MEHEKSISDFHLIQMAQEAVAGGESLDAARVLLFRELGRRGIIAGFVELPTELED